MSEPVRFSVLVPVYNVAPYLSACVDSVLGQSYSNFELLLVDDGSTDDSGRICDAYAAQDARVKVFHKANGGLISARRYAVERFSGDYCVFLDSDDSIVPDTLEILEKAIRESEADCVIYGIRWNRPGGVEHILCPPEICGRVYTDKREVLNILLNDSSFNSLCRKCVKASCFDGRDFSPYFGVSRGEDRLQSTEILENAGRFFFLPDELYIYRVNDSSITHSVSYDGYRADSTVDRYVQQYLDRCGLLLPEDLDRLRNRQLDDLVIELKRICRYCSTPDSARAAMESVLADPYWAEQLALGYRPAPPLPGQNAVSGLRRRLNRIALSLLRRRSWRALIFFCTRVYAAG